MAFFKFIRQIEHLQYFAREAAKKEKQKKSCREQETGAFLRFGPFGSRCRRRNFPVSI
jgi:hypothetical protein